MVATINPDASHIWDDAEAWIQSKADVDAAGGIANCMPTYADDDFETKGWGYVGLIDAKKGIPVDPSGDVNEFDAFGHAAYRSKFSKGKLKTGFTALEDNAVTAGIVLPGSTSDKVGVPRDLQYYVLYRTIDEGFSDVARVSLRPALLELKSHSGAVEGEQEQYEFVAHHSADSNKDVFQKLSSAPVPTKWLVTLSGTTAGDELTLTVTTSSQVASTSAIAQNAASTSVKTALESLANVGASNSTVSGSAGGPYTITLTKGGTITAALTGSGSVSVASVPV